jgi:hypothetical protein
MSETQQIEGIVSAVSQRADRYGVKIGEDWYGGFGTCPVSRGDRVHLGFLEKGQWKNIANIEPLMMQPQPELSDEEIAELQEKIRQRNYTIAEQSIEDAKQLLANSGLRDAVTPRNVVTFAERLAERRILHASRLVEDYARKKRLEWKNAARRSQAPEEGRVEVEDSSTFFGKKSGASQSELSLRSSGWHPSQVKKTLSQITTNRAHETPMRR